ncbi:hypothetical protein DFH08DRAFT_971658 [Mycena albidolilacea]|uniref:Uncharacterized protein n=1 Tax=Mycena albidolilacea TaxID=1033008 RepID=A0AAD7EFL5_9AGAR|nr:hypothetical protein DFH08DRAFT_971658 [Mycena albidolilacea]
MDPAVPFNVPFKLASLSPTFSSVTTTQTYIYYSFPEDSRKIKALVAFVWYLVSLPDHLYMPPSTPGSMSLRARRSGWYPSKRPPGFRLSSQCYRSIRLRVYTLSKRLYMSLIISLTILLRLLSLSVVAFVALKLTLSMLEIQWGWMFFVSSVCNQRLSVRKRTTELVDKWTIDLPIN